MLTKRWVKHIQKRFHIPVDSSYPGTYWIISIDRESQMPTSEELRQLQSYREFWVRQVYNEEYAQKILANGLPRCSGHNTAIFRKGSPAGNGAEQYWFYRKMTWQSGPMFVPDVMGPNYKGLTLVELLDQHLNDLRADNWTQWKKEHLSIFPAN
jgi:hypothetical protein